MTVKSVYPVIFRVHGWTAGVGVVETGVVGTVVGTGSGTPSTRISVMFETDLPPVAFVPISRSGQTFLPLIWTGSAEPVQGVRDDVVRAEGDLLAREGPVVPVGRDHADGVALLGEGPVEGEVRVLVPVVDVADEPPEGHPLPDAAGRVRVARRGGRPTRGRTRSRTW